MATRKGRVRPFAASIQTKTYLERLLRAWKLTINLPILHLLGTPVDGPGFFGTCLECCLEHTSHSVTALTKSLCFKGNLASLATCHLTQTLWWHLFLCIQSPVTTEVLVTSKLGHRLPDCLRVSVSYELGHYKC